MSIPYYPASSGHQHQTQHGFPSSSSPSQGNIHTGTSGNNQAANGGPTSPLRSGAFFERHNIFARSRSSFSSAAAASVPSLRSDSPDPNQAGYSPVEPASPTSRRSAFRPGLLTRHSSSSTSRIPLEHVRSNSSSNNDRVGFPASRPSTSFRLPQDEQEMSGSNGPRMAGSNQMVRTESSGGTGSSTNPFGRMFRRYSQGQGVHARTNSNASDAPPQLGSSVMPTGTNARTTGSGGRNLPPLDTGSNNDSVPAAITSAAPERSLSEQTTGAGSNGPPASAPAVTTSTTTGSSSALQTSGTNPSAQAGIHRLRLVPHLEATRSLHFEPIERDVRESATPVKIGRFTDRGPAATTAAATEEATTSRVVGSSAPSGSAPGNRGGAVPTTAGGGGRIDSARIAFKSKVVSRGHAEIWCEAGGKFFIRDTKSSSGTFLNHIRLAGANIESKPFPIKDGDILQLGVDYQGGTEEIYRCVKIRVELNRGWQREANQFNVNALRQLRALQGSPIQTASSKAAVTSPGAGELPTNRQSMNVTDCCICLFSVTVCQALFIAPCSHVFHYKCIRPLLSSHYPGFSCPLCRTFADLEADVEEDEAWQEALLKEAQNGEAGKAQGPSTPMVEMPTSVGSSGQSTESPFVPSQAINQREGGSSVPSQPSVPFTSSRLRQQVHHDASSIGGNDGAQRPATAVADTAFSEDQYDGTMVFPEGSRRGHGRRTSSDSNGGGEDDDDEDEVEDDEEEEEEEEEMLLDDRAGFGAEVMHEIDRISEEVDRSGSSSFARGSGSPRGIQARRGSQPISIQGVEGGRFPAGQTAASSGFSPLEEARTPVNQHVLSVLAEAPPPSSAAARRLAAQRQQQSVGIVGMPSLGGASSDLLDVGAPFSGPRGSDAGSRRGSNVSEDVGYLTPAEGSQDGDAGINGSSGVHRSPSDGARGSPSVSRRSLGSGSPREQRPGQGAAASASTSSNRASPSTAGEMEVDEDGDEEDDYAMVDATSGPRGGVEAQGSRRGSAMGSSTKGKSRKRETSANGSFDSQGSHSQQQQQQQRHGQASPTPLQGGAAKVKSMFRRASGGGGAA